MKKKARSLASTLQFCRLGWRLELWPCLPRAHVAGRSQGPPRWPPSRPTEDERQRAEDERDAVPWAGIIRSPVCWAESFIMNHLLLDQFSALLRSKF